ncbi:hypothetical protein BVG19_g945 [[Candida] boidinii]|nr:hypothetical protein BVG19_g945 [[Candida] boidinii]OWB50590.1 hypothetical protein B5S27_g2141 [[Candida] boidinii]
MSPSQSSLKRRPPQPIDLSQFEPPSPDRISPTYSAPKVRAPLPPLPLPPYAPSHNISSTQFRDSFTDRALDFGHNGVLQGRDDQISNSPTFSQSGYRSLFSDTQQEEATTPTSQYFNYSPTTETPTVPNQQIYSSSSSVVIPMMNQPEKPRLSYPTSPQMPLIPLEYQKQSHNRQKQKLTQPLSAMTEASATPPLPPRPSYIPSPQTRNSSVGSSISTSHNTKPQQHMRNISISSIFSNDSFGSTTASIPQSPATLKSASAYSFSLKSPVDGTFLNDFYPSDTGTIVDYTDSLDINVNAQIHVDINSDGIDESADSVTVDNDESDWERIQRLQRIKSVNHKIPDIPNCASPTFATSNIVTPPVSNSTAATSGISSTNDDLSSENSSILNRRSSMNSFPSFEIPEFENPNDGNLVRDINELPINIQQIMESKLSLHKEHNMDGYVSDQLYKFWELTSDEVTALNEFDPELMKIQGLIYEIFKNFEKIRINLRRLVEHYGVKIREIFPKISLEVQAEIKKIFEIIKIYYNYVDKLVRIQLKPAFDFHIFVNESEVLSILKLWLNNLGIIYSKVSNNFIRLANILNHEEIKHWLDTAETTDPFAKNSRGLPWASQLFNLYFLKGYTSLGTPFEDLIKIYQKKDNLEMIKLCIDAFDELGKINSIADYTQALDIKIKLNSKIYSSDHTWLRMLDIFNIHREYKFDSDIEVYNNIEKAWTLNHIVLFDNYLLLLKVKKDEFYKLKHEPIPIQYLEWDFKRSNSIQDPSTLTIYNSANSKSYRCRSNIIGPLIELLPKTKMEFYKKKMSNSITLSNYELRLINGATFSTTIPANNFQVFDLGDMDPINKFINENTSQILNTSRRHVNTEVLCVDYFKNKDSIFFLVGTTSGIFTGNPDNPSSWKCICSNLKNVRQISVVRNSFIVILNDDRLHSSTVKNVLDQYFKKTSSLSTSMIDKRVQLFKVGLQNVKGSSSSVSKKSYIECLAYCKDKKILSTVLDSKNNFKLNLISMKAQFPVLTFDFVKPSVFVFSNFNDNRPIFYASSLETMTVTELPNLDTHEQKIKDFKLRIRAQTPVASFMTNSKDKDIILVYSKFFLFVKLDPKTATFTQSRREIINFGFTCKSATFDADRSTIVLCGESNIEVWHIPYSPKSSSELTLCFTGYKTRLLNSHPGKFIIGLSRNINNKPKELIFQLKLPEPMWKS